jgi:hypothetical protein
MLPGGSPRIGSSLCPTAATAPFREQIPAVALNRIEETAEPLRAEIAATPLPERPLLIQLSPATTAACATDK